MSDDFGAGAMCGFVAGAVVIGILILIVGSILPPNVTVTSGTVTSIQDTTIGWGTPATVITIHHSDGTQVATTCSNLESNLPLVGENITLISDASNWFCSMSEPPATSVSTTTVSFTSTEVTTFTSHMTVTDILVPVNSTVVSK